MSDTKALQKYGTWSPATVQKEKEEAAAESGGMWFKAKVGKNHLRFLPPAPGTKSPFTKVWGHRIPTDGGKAITIACPRMMRKEPCKACAVAEDLKRARNKVDRDYGYQIHAKKKYYANVIDRKNPERGVLSSGLA